MSRSLPGTALLTLVVLFSNQCIKKTESKEIFKDQFNRTDTSLGANYTINLPGGTSFKINSNRAYPSSTGSLFAALPSAMYTKKVTGAHKISASFQIAGGTYTGSAFIIGRSAASDVGSDSYVCGYDLNTALTTPKQVFMLGRVSSGTLSILADVGLHTLSAGIQDTVTFTFDGTTIKCEMAGNSTMSITVKDSTFGDGYAGLAGGNNAGNFFYFDDFLIEKL